jgi:hypothetical protein
MTQALARLKAQAADEMFIELCNQKTAELLASLNLNVARVFRLEKEHTLVFGRRSVCAYGEWYTTHRLAPIDNAVVEKTTKFLNRMFTHQPSLGKRTSESGNWYFESNDPNLLVCMTVTKMKVPNGSGSMAPMKFVPQYMEVYYIARSYLG